MNVYKKYLLIVFAFSLCLTFISCDIKDPVQGLEVRLNSIKRETLVTAYIIDAKSGDGLEQSVKVKFIGTNANQIIDETNFPKTDFTAKNGFFNFGILDGAVISQSSPFKVLISVKSAGYLDKEFPLNITSKGVQAVTLFLAKAEDFQDNITNNSFDGGNSNNNGTVMDSVKVTSNDGTSITIPGGTTLKTDNGTPLTGNLTATVTNIFVTQQTTSLVPGNLQVNGSQSIQPLLLFSLMINDQNGNEAGAISQNVVNYVPLPLGTVNPVNGNSFQAGDKIRAWRLNSSGSYIELFPEASIVQKSTSGLGKITTDSLGLEIYGDPDIIGDVSQSCDFIFNITNPRQGFNLQIFKNHSLIYTNSEIAASITVERSDSDPVDTYEFKFGANPATGLGGTLYASYTSESGCGSGSASVTFDYPAASIQANVNINGVCTSRDPVVRVYPSITFNYRKKGTTVWQQGSLTNGQAVIAGLEPNTIYEAKATYKDKEASVDIHVVDASTFTVTAGDDQGSLLRTEITGTTVINGESIVNIEIDIDLKDDCD